jgi:hypothetical protein
LVGAWFLSWLLVFVLAVYGCRSEARTSLNGSSGSFSGTPPASVPE